MVMSDLDGDGYPELVLACEWGPVRVMRNEKGRFKEATRELGLEGYTGWWNGVSTGDFDGDGRMDIVASNWGQNTKYEHHRQQPLKLYYGNFSGSGDLSTIETWHDLIKGDQVPLRHLDLVAKSIPDLIARFPSHQSFAEASIGDVLGEGYKSAKSVSANWLETTVFLNRGGHFERRVLPMPAQLAPAFAICVADFDGDGRDDVFLSQNFFGVEPESSRHDAGRGLWLKGDGSGNFRAITGQESGVIIYGEQRGAALADFDRDGRVDLAVTQNGAETKLFRNMQGRAGIRVRLKGTAGNPSGIGSAVRLKYGSTFGPVREIHAGSGYWSQDSLVAVLGKRDEPGQLWVRWPGGAEVLYDLLKGVVEVEVRPSGELTQVR